MKKKLFLICVITLLSATSVYAGCEGGTEINGGYCRSNKPMNWWSAYNWCKANGRTMPSIYDVCPDWDGNAGSACPTMKGQNENCSDYCYSWVTTVKDSGTVWYINLLDGKVHSPNVNIGRESALYALCK